MTPAWICMPPAVLSAFVGVIAALLGASAPSLRERRWDHEVSVRLADGRALGGRHRGAIGSWSDPAGYPARFAAWQDSLRAGAVAPALGESLVLVRRPGEPVAGAFRGFGPRAVLLGTADSCLHLVVLVDHVIGVDGPGARDSSADLAELRETWASGPALDALAIDVAGTTFAIPVHAFAAGEWTPPPSAAGELVRGVAGGAAIGLGMLAASLALASVVIWSLARSTPRSRAAHR